MNPGDTPPAATPTIAELEERIRKLTEEKVELAHEAEWWEIQHGRMRLWRMYALWAMAAVVMFIYQPLGAFAFLAATWYCWDDAGTAGEATARSTYPWVRRGNLGT
jgi:hypothetical protein